jgi:hypothetical protein
MIENNRRLILSFFTAEYDRWVWWFLLSRCPLESGEERRVKSRNTGVARLRKKCRLSSEERPSGWCAECLKCQNSWRSPQATRECSVTEKESAREKARERKLSGIDMNGPDKSFPIVFNKPNRLWMKILCLTWPVRRPGFTWSVAVSGRRDSYLGRTGMCRPVSLRTELLSLVWTDDMEYQNEDDTRRIQED